MEIETKSGKRLNIKTIKRAIGHTKLAEDGYKLTAIRKGYFKNKGRSLVTPVLEYRKPRYINIMNISIVAGYSARCYNRFGLIQACAQ